MWPWSETCCVKIDTSAYTTLPLTPGTKEAYSLHSACKLQVYICVMSITESSNLRCASYVTISNMYMHPDKVLHRLALCVCSSYTWRSSRGGCCPRHPSLATPQQPSTDVENNKFESVVGPWTFGCSAPRDKHHSGRAMTHIHRCIKTDRKENCF